MPVIIEWTYADGTKELDRIPAEIWRVNESKFTKVFLKDKEVVQVVIDPQNETADVDGNNNSFPSIKTSKFDDFKINRRDIRS